MDRNEEFFSEANLSQGSQAGKYLRKISVIKRGHGVGIRYLS